MTEATYKEFKVTLKLDMYALRMFGQSVGAETPAQAMSKLQDVYKQGETVTFELYDVVSALFFHMAERGSMVAKKLPFTLTKEDCYDVLMDEQAVAAMLLEINNFFPEPETVKKKQLAEAVE